MTPGKMLVIDVSSINMNIGKAISGSSLLSRGWSGHRESASALFKIPGLCLILISYCMIQATAHCALWESHWGCW